MYLYIYKRKKKKEEEQCNAFLNPLIPKFLQKRKSNSGPAGSEEAWPSFEVLEFVSPGSGGFLAPARKTQRLSPTPPPSTLFCVFLFPDILLEDRQKIFDTIHLKGAGGWVRGEGVVTTVKGKGC